MLRIGVSELLGIRVVSSSRYTPRSVPEVIQWIPAITKGSCQFRIGMTRPIANKQVSSHENQGERLFIINM